MDRYWKSVHLVRTKTGSYPVRTQLNYCQGTVMRCLMWYIHYLMVWLITWREFWLHRPLSIVARVRFEHSIWMLSYCNAWYASNVVDLMWPWYLATWCWDNVAEYGYDIVVSANTWDGCCCCNCNESKNKWLMILCVLDAHDVVMIVWWFLFSLISNSDCRPPSFTTIQ